MGEKYYSSVHISAVCVGSGPYDAAPPPPLSAGCGARCARIPLPLSLEGLVFTPPGDSMMVGGGREDRAERGVGGRRSMGKHLAPGRGAGPNHGKHHTEHIYLSRPASGGWGRILPQVFGRLANFAKTTPKTRFLAKTPEVK